MEPENKPPEFFLLKKIKGKGRPIKKHDLFLYVSSRFRKSKNHISLVSKKPNPKKPLILKNYFFCVICSDFFIEPVSTPCGHTFCRMCIMEFIFLKSKCFQCDEQLRPNSVIPVRAISNEMQSLVSELTSEQQEFYKKRQQAHFSWAKAHSIKKSKPGQKLEIFRGPGVWEAAEILKVLENKAGHKTLLLKIADESGQEELVCNRSPCLASPGTHIKEGEEAEIKRDNCLNRESNNSTQGNYEEEILEEQRRERRLWLMNWLARSIQFFSDSLRQ